MKPIPHPATQILVWVLLALLAQHQAAAALLVLNGVLLAVSLKLCAKQLLRLLRRTRWIMFSLFLIYAYTTPGTALWPAFGLASPTQEGMMDGVLQLGRLLCVLSGLAILLALLTQRLLISGLYSLVYPLRWFGMSRERFAVRLALTLEYAETSMGETASDWRASIAHAMRPSKARAAHIEMQLQPFGLVDVLLLLACMAVLTGVW